MKKTLPDCGINCEVGWREITPPKHASPSFFNYYQLCFFRYCRLYSEESDLLSILSFSLFGVIDMVVSFVAFRLVLNNSRVGRSVKWLLLANVALRFSRGPAELYFASCLVQLGRKPHCISTKNYPWSGAMLNQIMSAFYLYSHVTIQFFEHATTINRFFAVSFDGVYYKRVSKGLAIQCFFLLILPMIFYFGPIGAPFIRLDEGLYTLPGYMYQINHYSFMQPDFGNIFDTLIIVHYYLLGTLCVIALIIDGFTLQKFRKRMRSNHIEAGQKRADLRLSVQMLLTHGMNLCYWIMYFVINALSDGYGSQDIFRYIYGQRSFNQISTILMTVENVLQGLLIIYFNWGEEGERRSNDSSVNMNTTKISGKLMLK